MTVFTEKQFYKWVTVLKHTHTHKANVMERLLEAETESVTKTVSEQMVYAKEIPPNFLRCA